MKCKVCGKEADDKWICGKCSEGKTPTDLITIAGNIIAPNNPRMKDFICEVNSGLIKQGAV